MRVAILQNRYGVEFIFDDLSPLSRTEYEQLLCGESIMYEGKEYTFRKCLDDGAWLYVETGRWMELNPLVQLDRQIQLGEK